MRELDSPEKEIVAPEGRTRNEGGGRKRPTEQMLEITGKLKDLVEDTTCGDPETPLLWTATGKITWNKTKLREQDQS